MQKTSGSPLVFSSDPIAGHAFVADFNAERCVCYGYIRSVETIVVQVRWGYAR